MWTNATQPKLLGDKEENKCEDGYVFLRVSRGVLKFKLLEGILLIRYAVLSLGATLYTYVQENAFDGV